MSVKPDLKAAVAGSPPAVSAKNSEALKVTAGLTELQVWAVPANPHLLICHVPEEDGSNPMLLVSVQVRDNTNFTKKMLLRVRRIADKRYALEGPCPRWRGKW